MKFILSFLLLVSMHIGVQAQQLSNRAKASLITCGAGDDLYSVFGHSALRISDPGNNLDVVFNYGTFDFNTPNFYLKFARGKLDYILSTSTFSHFLREYEYEERYVFEQDLNLSKDDLDLLFQELLENYLPENRSYRYDFFYDNCSTRIRDLIKKILGERLDYRTEEVDSTSMSFRDWIDVYTFNVPWGDFGIDLALGLPTDKKVNGFHEMFLPERMKEAFDRALLDGEPLVSESRMVLDYPVRENYFQWFTPTQLTWLLLIIVFLLMWRKVYPIWLDKLFFSVFGLVGIALLLLWFATDHTATAYNFNLLWALPTWFIFLFNKSNTLWTLRIHTILLIFLMTGWIMLPQSLHPAVFPILILLVVRMVFYYRLVEVRGD
jgi:hypothetical protein